MPSLQCSVLLDPCSRNRKLSCRLGNGSYNTVYSYIKDKARCHVYQRTNASDSDTHSLSLSSRPSIHASFHLPYLSPEYIIALSPSTHRSKMFAKTFALFAFTALAEASGSCPAIWSTVASDLSQSFIGSNGCTDLARGAIRFAFHDSGMCIVSEVQVSIY